LAGRLVRGGPALVDRIIAILGRQGFQVTPLATSRPGEAGEIARRALASGADLILVVGGDGTVNEVLNGMAGSDVPMGVIPAGTANVLAAELDLARRIDVAAARIAELVPARISVGLLRCAQASRYFLLMAGIGLDAQIVVSLDTELKKRIGKLAYWLGSLGQLGRPLAQFSVSARDRRLQCGFALASRVRNYGGDLEIATTASLLDDCFELVCFEGDTSIQYLKYFTGILTRRLPEMQGVSFLEVESAEFSAPPGVTVYVQADGEPVGSLPASVKIVPGALTLLVPPSLPQRYGRPIGRVPHG